MNADESPLPERAIPDTRADPFAAGMVHYTETEQDSTLNYDRFQFDLFRKHLKGRILEVGAGPGRISDLVIQAGGFDEFVVLEPSPYFATYLRKRFQGHEKVRLTQSEVKDLEATHSGHFDVIFSVHVLEHIQDDTRFVEEMKRLLKPGGELIVLVPALQFLFSNLDRNIGHYRRYNKRTLSAVLTRNGLRIERMFYNNLIGVLASLYFFKIRGIEYQSSDSKKERFFHLSRIFSTYFVPVIRVIERAFPVPVGLNLTAIAVKEGKSSL